MSFHIQSSALVKNSFMPRHNLFVDLTNGLSHKSQKLKIFLSDVNISYNGAVFMIDLLNPSFDKVSTLRGWDLASFRRSISFSFTATAVFSTSARVFLKSNINQTTKFLLNPILFYLWTDQIPELQTSQHHPTRIQSQKKRRFSCAF